MEFADDGDASGANRERRQAEIVRLEGRMEELRDRIEFCRKAIAASRIVLGIAAALLVLALLGLVRSTPALLLAIAGIMGGLIGMGSNRTTAQQARAALAACRAERDALIDGLAPKALV
ncbi:MAG: hypothetical protein ACK5JM_05750 [Rhodoblastus sp.]